MTDISGLPKGTQPSGPTPSEEQPLVSDISLEPTTGVDTLVYEGTDTISPSAGLHLLNFFVDKRIYEANIRNPELPPPDPEGQSGPQPYGMAEQRLIKQKIAQKVVERLKENGLAAQKELYEAIVSGKPISDPKLAKMAKDIREEVTAFVREGAHLPDSWTLTSTSAKDWIPTPVAPYDAAKQKEIDNAYHVAFDKSLKSYASKIAPPLTAEQIEQIAAAYTSGKVPATIAEHFTAVSKIATEEVQKTFGLPNTWFRGTTTIEDWKPINLGIVTPKAVNQARLEMLLNNAEVLAKNLCTSMQEVLSKFPPDDPIQDVGKEYITIISKAIRELKAALRDIEVKDAEKSQDAARARADMTKSRQKALQEQIEKQKEAQEKQEKAEKTSFIMKIVGPIVAVLATVVGVLISIATFGLGSPLGVALIVAGIAVGIALTTYSIVDSVTGCTSKLIESFNKWVEGMVPKDEAKQKWVKLAIVAAIVAVLAIVIVVVTVLSGGGAAANIATQAVAQAAKQAVLEAIKQLTIQMIVMVIMSSNAIPELLGAILKANGVDEKTSKIWEIVVMAVTMVITMIAIAKGAGAGGAKGIGQAAQAEATAASVGFVATIQNIGRQVQAACENLVKAIKEGAEATIRELRKLINELLTRLITYCQNVVGPAFQELKESVSALGQAITTRDVGEIAKGAVRLGSAVSKFAEVTVGASVAYMLDLALDALMKVGGKVKETGQNLAEAFKEIKKGFEGITDLLKAYVRYKDLLKDMATLGAEELKELKHLETVVIPKLGGALSMSTTKSLQLTSGAIEIANGITQGVMGLQVYQLLKEVGEDKMAAELLQTIIDQLNKLLQRFSEGMEANVEGLRGLNQFLTNFMANQSKLSSEMAQALRRA